MPIKPPPAPRSRLTRRSLTIVCVLIIGALIAAGAPAPSRAQQPAGPKDPGHAAARPAEKNEADAAPAKAKAVPARKKGQEAAERARVTDIARMLFRSLFLAELRFARFASGASEEQARRMARAARDPLRKAIAEGVDRRLAEHGPEILHLTAAHRASQQAVASIAEAELSREQWVRFRDQVDRRAARRKQVAIRGLAARLEQELRLTAQQRDKISESLAAHWDSRWAIGAILLDSNAALPEIPGPVILPILTGTQRSAWARLAKGHANAELVTEVAVITAEGDPVAAELDPDRAPK